MKLVLRYDTEKLEKLRFQKRVSELFLRIIPRFFPEFDDSKRIEGKSRAFRYFHLHLKRSSLQAHLQSDGHGLS